MSIISDRKYRLNPNFTVTSPDELTPELRRRYDKLANKNKDYYILHALPEARLSVKIINSELAHFLSQLENPLQLKELKGSFRQGKEKDQQQFINRLLLNSVLEVEIDGEFCSGVKAMNQLLDIKPGFTSSKTGHKTEIQLLSEKALHFAYHSALNNPRDISFLLYDFNRLPMSKRWLRRFPDEKSVTTFFGLNDDDTWRGMPEEITVFSSNEEEGSRQGRFHRFWRYWRLGKRESPRNRLSYKVYLSYKPLDLSRIFEEIRERAFNAGAHAIKLPRTLTGLLRPDKLIVYFTEYSPAMSFAEALANNIEDVTCHGAPFTFQLNPKQAGVTMGVDPPREKSERLSWRLYLTAKLALAIQGARRENTEDFLDYIHTHMHAIGVDSENWRPLNDRWDIDFHLEGLENTPESRVARS